MRTAAALLSSTRSVDALREVVRAIGLAGDEVELDASARQGVGLDEIEHAMLLGGLGAFRVLIVGVPTNTAFRDSLQRVARRLSSRAPHVLWLVAAANAGGTEAALVAWSSDARAPRVASFLWEPAHVVDSDAETLCALAAVNTEPDVLFHSRCLEILGREALTRRFYRALQEQITAIAAEVPADPEDAQGVALLYASRLLFLCFLEAKGWLDSQRAFMANRFDECMRSGGGFHQRVLLPLFFGTLNTKPSARARAARAFGRIPFLNGGLFTPTPLERRVKHWRFSDARFGALFDEVFCRFRFVAREDSATWSAASVDPEMLGRAFESLMFAPERRAGGVFYTPHDLVSRVAERALEAALPTPTLRSLREVRVLDPACGSGAFLVYMLERLAEVRGAHGDEGSIAEVRRRVLARSIFGVDRSPTAVWLCELRLWLSVVIESAEEDPLRVPPLPNLDRNIRVGDTLVGSGFLRDNSGIFVGSAKVAELRQRYIRATGARKQSLARSLDREERRRMLAQTDREIESVQYARQELIAAQRQRDLFGERRPLRSEARRELKRLRDRTRALRKERRRIADGGAMPLSFGACFADAQARGGFDLVLGNPPWVRLHHIPKALRLHFKTSYDVYRFAAWKRGAETALAGQGFSSQVDLAALFVERSVDLLRDGGIVSLLLPAKLWRSLAGGGLRHLLLQRTRVVRLEDQSESRHAFAAAVYPSLLVAQNSDSGCPEVAVAVHTRSGERAWNVSGVERLAFDDSPGAPWLILSNKARAAFDKLRVAGPALGTSQLGPPRLGVKSGCNAAFLVTMRDCEGDIATIVGANGEVGCVEASLLRPALRGDAVTAWHRSPSRECILWTHDEHGAPLARLPDRGRAWLRRFYNELVGRADASRARRWWSLFRTEAADASTARVVWADFGRRPRALVLQAGDCTVPLNTCYVIRCPDERDASTLAALLNSRLVAAWLNALAEPARGGYRRYLAWTVAQLPLPRNWAQARASLSVMSHTDDEQLLHAVVAAYGLTVPDVAALLE